MTTDADRLLHTSWPCRHCTERVRGIHAYLEHLRTAHPDVWNTPFNGDPT